MTILIPVVLILLLLVAIALTIRLAAQSASRATQIEHLRAERDELASEVDQLRPLESRLAAAEATVAAKQEAWERLETDHGEALDAFRDQSETLTEVSGRLDRLGRQTEDAVKKGEEAASGSARTEQLFLGWTKSISNPQSRGALGELAIERQLTDLGLVKGRDFVSQEYGHDGRRRDLVVRAGEVRVIIDSKWTADPAIGELGEALRDDDRIELAAWGKRLRDRAKTLAGRGYARGEERGSKMVLMYVPVEGAYDALALVEGFSLEKFSRDTGVYVVTPSQVGLAISLVAELWRDAGREEKLLELARELSGMGERLAEVVEELDGMGRAIGTVVNYYDRIVGRLTNRGGLYQQARALWVHVGRRFKKEVFRGPDGEVLRLAKPRDDAARHAETWRELEAGSDPDVAESA